MGLYDEINIDHKWLPERKRVPYDLQSYQTKSLGCYLNNYVILEDGKLLISKYDEYSPMGSEIKPVVYTGEIKFYDDFSEYKAWCVNGIVKEVIDVT